MYKTFQCPKVKIESIKKKTTENLEMKNLGT